MKVFTVQTLESFMSLQYGLPEMDFFRGQSSSEYKLIPSIGRRFKEGQEDVLKQYEKEVFEDFKENIQCLRMHALKMIRNSCF